MGHPHRTLIGHPRSGGAAKNPHSLFELREKNDLQIRAADINLIA
jgi:hypothetical protein